MHIRKKAEIRESVAGLRKKFGMLKKVTILGGATIEELGIYEHRLLAIDRDWKNDPGTIRKMNPEEFSIKYSMQMKDAEAFYAHVVRKS